MPSPLPIPRLWKSVVATCSIIARAGAGARTLAGCVALATATVGPSHAAPPEFELFAMDNGVGRGSWTPARQAATLREVGFTGISYNYTNPADLKVWLAELQAAGRAFRGLYFTTRLDRPQAFPDGIEEAVAALRGSGAVLWLTVQGPARPGERDAEAIRRIQAAADLAASAGLRVSLYPHQGFYLTTAEQALELTLRSGRANVGVTVNLTHELAAGNGARLPEIIRLVAPCLTMVTINGATDRPDLGGSNRIKLLGEGDYDVGAIVRTLAEVKYHGPIGVQFYSIKGDPDANLRATMSAWRKMTGSATPINQAP
jgi:sugar phosphate isomerase/epimerase